MVFRRFTSREFAGRSSFSIKLSNPSDTCLREVCTAFSSSTLLGNLSPYRCARNFYRYSFTFLFYYTYTYSFFDKISHTFCEKTAIHSLICLLRSLLLPTCSIIVQTSSTIWQFVFLTEWLEDRKNRCLSSSTNSVGLHFHEGIEKIKGNDKNTKIENLQNGQEKYGGKNLAYVYSWGKN